MSIDPNDRKAQTRMQFNAIAADYDNGSGCFAHFGQRLVATAGVKPGQTVLDVACGRGAVLFPAAEALGAVGNIVGLDLADEMVRVSTPEQKCIGSPGQKYISNVSKKAPELGAFSSGIRLGWDYPPACPSWHGVYGVCSD
jgi:ubiquinone/menaquinone biosynthesis C-methylase UbiE